MEQIGILRPVRSVLFLYAIAVVSIILIALVWFMFHYMFWIVQPVASTITQDLNLNNTQYAQVDTFFQGIDNWAAILGLIALFLFVIVYSQRRGQDA